MKPSNVKVEIYITAGWTDISGDIVSSIKYKHGILGLMPSDVIGDIGSMSFVLNNTNRKYLPNSGGMAGWDRGVPCRLIISYDNEDIKKWYGTVDGIDFDTPLDGLPTVEITVLDYIDILSKYPLEVQSMQLNQRIDEAAQILINQLNPQPLATYFSEGNNIFPTVFDAAGTKASTYSELNKLALSELGYVYVRHANPEGETLVIENSTDRLYSSYTPIPLIKSYSGFIKQEIGDFLLQETGEKIYLNETTTVNINNDIYADRTTYGKNLITQFSLKAYPRYIDTGSSVLFNLDYPIELPVTSGSPKYYKFSYADPNGGGGRVIGKDMIVPIRNDDYKMWQNRDGTGTDLSDYLTVSTVDTSGCPSDFGASGAIYKLENTGASAGYVTLLRARGYGIYFYNPIAVLINDVNAIQKYGVVQDSFDQKYINDITIGETFAALFLGKEKTPRQMLENIEMCANISESLMLAFLYHDVGDQINVQYSKQGISSDYFIQAVEAEIGLDWIIKFNWTLNESAILSTDIFAFDDTTYGLLDSGNVLGY